MEQRRSGSGERLVGWHAAGGVDEPRYAAWTSLGYLDLYAADPPTIVVDHTRDTSAQAWVQHLQAALADSLTAG
jgi:hypothetical protein